MRRGIFAGDRIVKAVGPWVAEVVSQEDHGRTLSWV